MKQEEILLSLVQGKNGVKWADAQVGWKKQEDSPEGAYENDPCTWTGVSCESGAVTDIQVQGTFLMATIPEELGMLISLRVFNVSSNLIFGTIPADVAALPNLEALDIRHNQVNGPIPHFGSTALRVLALEDNRLSGTIPEALGDSHPELRDLNLIDNRLVGPIPSSLAKLNNLVYLQLSGNSLHGSVPSTLGSLTNLQFLYLDNNELVGEIPADIALARSSKLKEAWFQKNQFSGTVPAGFAELASLTEFYVDENKLTGYLPPDLCRPEINKDFYDDYPEFFSIAGTDHRDLCQSIACPPEQWGTDGIWPCYACPANGTNPYLGQYGKRNGDACFPIEQTPLLRELYDKTGGDNWVGGNNWFIEGYDECDFTGVTCNAEKHVVRLELSNMRLTGTIPESIGFFEHLEVLDLSHNDLTGFLPSDIRFAPLSVLDVSGNGLKGVVPPKLCMQRINGNGKDGSSYQCNRIACPQGMWSPTGQGDCKPCNDGHAYLAKNFCLNEASNANGSRTAGQKFGVFIGVCLLIGSIAGLIFLGYRVVRNRIRGGSIVTTAEEMEVLDDPQLQYAHTSHLHDVHLDDDHSDNGHSRPSDEMFTRQVT